LTPLYPIFGTWLIIGPVFLLTLTFAGVFYGYLQLTSKSVWPATLAHGAINACLNTFFLYTVTDSPVTLEYLATEKGVVMLAATALSAGWLIFRLRQHHSLPALQMPASA
jgi:membrane protease YdiL (CAAX protease family)